MEPTGSMPQHKSSPVIPYLSRINPICNIVIHIFMISFSVISYLEVTFLFFLSSSLFQMYPDLSLHCHSILIIDFFFCGNVNMRTLDKRR